MALHGDLSSFPLPELLQWLDSSRKTGALHVQTDAGTRKIFVLAGQIVATASPGLWERLARVPEIIDVTLGVQAMQTLRAGQTDSRLALLAEIDLIGSLVDLVNSQGGRFHWTEDPDRGEDEWASLELPARHALFESLRWLDEMSDVERALPSDALQVSAVPGRTPPPALLQHVLTVMASGPDQTLGRLWLALGLSRTVVLRAVFDLLRGGVIRVDGAATPELDPVADMLEKGALLLRERQFDAASLVFSALLQKDPGDRRVRDFARMVEREHSAELYRELPPVTQFAVEVPPEGLGTLRHEERQLVAQAQSGWDVSTLVLASGRREVDTLKALQKLVRQGVLHARADEALTGSGSAGTGR